MLIQGAGAVFIHLVEDPSEIQKTITIASASFDFLGKTSNGIRCRFVAAGVSVRVASRFDPTHRRNEVTVPDATVGLKGSHDFLRLGNGKFNSKASKSLMHLIPFNGTGHVSIKFFKGILQCRISLFDFFP